MSHTTLSQCELRCSRIIFPNLRSHEDFEVVDVLLLDQLLDLGLHVLQRPPLGLLALLRHLLNLPLELGDLGVLLVGLALEPGLLDEAVQFPPEIGRIVRMAFAGTPVACTVNTL